MTDFPQDNGDQQVAGHEAPADRRNERREFFRTALGAGAVAAVGAAAVAISSGAMAQATGETDYLNFVLNLEYLEAQFFSFAVNGTGLTSDQLAPGSASTTTVGAVTGGRAVTFTDPLVAQYAREIAGEKARLVTYLRGLLTTVTVAQPAIDIGATATSAFTLFARSAGIATNTSGAVDNTAGTFDPYASDANFLLAAYLLEDVCVTAYKALLQSFSTKAYIDGLAGIVGTTAYHAGIIRTVLYTKGATTPSLRTSADAISNTRDTLDGLVEDDQGISSVTLSSAVSATPGAYAPNAPAALIGQVASNIVPTGADGIVFGRALTNVLNIFYLNSLAVVKGGFFPNGLNGTYVTSAAN